jgi:hypothetical protein
MNLLADEGVDRPIVEQLRKDGHSVVYIAEMSPGIADDVILAQANANNALLLTPLCVYNKWDNGNAEISVE